MSIPLTLSPLLSSWLRRRHTCTRAMHRACFCDLYAGARSARHRNRTSLCMTRDDVSTLISGRAPATQTGRIVAKDRRRGRKNTRIKNGGGQRRGGTATIDARRDAHVTARPSDRHFFGTASRARSTHATFLRHTQPACVRAVRTCVRTACSFSFFDLSRMMEGEKRKIDRAGRPFFFL